MRYGHGSRQAFCGTRRIAMMHILIVEDDTRVAELIQRVLTEEGFQTTLAYDGHFGKKLAIQNTYDMIITDVILPGINGLELVKTLRNQGIESPILMLTALGTTDDKVEGFDAGADDYLVKPFEIRELMARIRALLKRNNPIIKDLQWLSYADLKMNLKSKTVSRGDINISLTPKEFKFLEFMLRHPERVLSKSEIAKEVWNTHFDTGTNFIEVYVNYLRKKIDRDFEPKLIHTKSGMGFILTRES